MLGPVLAALASILSAVAPRPPAGPPAPAPEPVPAPAEVPAPPPSEAPVEGSTGAELETTAYCLTGRMANGARAHQGAVASNRHTLGTRLHLSDSPWGPSWFVVADRIGWGSELDIAIPGDCRAARAWGRRRVVVTA